MKKYFWFSAFVFGITLLVNARPVHAATIVVNTTAQKPGGIGDCTLGEAIVAANTDTAVDGCAAGSGADVITVPAGMYKLTEADKFSSFIGYTGLPHIESDVTIEGAGAEMTIIERGDDAPEFRILYAAGENIVVRGFTVRGGVQQGVFVYSAGIGIEWDGITLEDMTISDNLGHGIGTGHGVIIRNILVINNVGGIALNQNHPYLFSNAVVSISDSEVVENLDFGIAGSNIDVAVNNSLVSRNGDDGIRLGESSAQIRASTIANNGDSGVSLFRGRSAQDARAKTTIETSAIYGNKNWGVASILAEGGRVNITNSTIASNDVGILLDKGHLRLIVKNSSIVKNKLAGGGIQSWDERSRVKLVNTILAKNSRARDSNCIGTIISRGFNIFGNFTNCDVALAKGDQLANPQLDAWADDGTPGNGNYPLLPNSPAINKGRRTACPVTDQLGNARVGRCDIGAIEFIPVP